MKILAPPFVAGLCVIGLTLAARAAPVEAPGLDHAILAADPFTVDNFLAKHSDQASPALRHYLQGVSAAARLNDADAQRELAAAYQDRGTSANIARRALSLAALTALREGAYARAARLYARVAKDYAGLMARADRVDNEQNLGVAQALSGQPRQSLDRPVTASIPLSFNVLGLMTAPLDVRSQIVTSVVDTGANLSVLSASTARRLGVRPLPDKVNVNSSTQSPETGVAVVDAIRLGPAVLHHVVFLVIDDSHLSFGGNQIDAIIGFPVLHAFERLTFQEDGPGPAKTGHLTVSPSRRDPDGASLRFQGFSPLVRANADGNTLPLFIDSGANDTSLAQRYARDFAAKLAGLETKTVKVGGAGGIEERRVAVFPNFVVGIGSAQVVLTGLTVDETGSGPADRYGTIGADVLWAKGGFSIDFGALTLSLGDGAAGRPG